MEPKKNPDRKRGGCYVGSPHFDYDNVCRFGLHGPPFKPANRQLVNWTPPRNALAGYVHPLLKDELKQDDESCAPDSVNALTGRHLVPPRLANPPPRPFAKPAHTGAPAAQCSATYQGPALLLRRTELATFGMATGPVVLTHPHVKAMMQKVKRLKEFGDTSDGGESEETAVSCTALPWASILAIL